MSRIWNYGIAGEKEQYNSRTAALGHRTLERRIFDLFEYAFVDTSITLQGVKSVVMEGCASGEEYVCSHITDFFNV